MSRIAYVNGRYVAHDQARVSIDDRAFHFADGVYEVAAVLDGRLVDLDGHLDRLERSLRELRIAAPMARRPLTFVMREIVRRNRLRDGLVYLQISRGVARRDHAFPAQAGPSLVMTARPVNLAALEAKAGQGVAVMTMPDIRWGRCDIKTVALLPNVLAKQAAREAGAYEAWLVDAQGHVTEGSSTNAWIVDAEGRVITRSLSNAILPGITRASLMAAARAAGITIVERSFTVAEAKAAREAFITSATAFVTPVVRIDEAAIGNGAAGSVALTLRALYLDHIRRSV
ncbi:D-amino-acid transaminase [Oleomonas cavernae]|uniref:Probable branched-chain-amino-acid aminotransferase n=1 Tax=Oleomonas cavernae TaxID=2320859 RepID=A0A418WBH7_9PROT|nr:D-amino-acid transaminase [Oleomonas cavernae]RJF87397.1 D-amino-acid transaminase [Oleomonas cavernae]